MVTIEQKLSLFSKLLQQDVKDDVLEKIKEVELEYDEKISEQKELVDKQAKELVDKHLKRAENKKIEIISKSKMENKRISMVAKEKYIDVFMEKLKQRIQEFVSTEEYKAYLEQQIKQCAELKDSSDGLIIHMTAKDKEEYGAFIIQELTTVGLKESQLTLAVAEDSIIGGMVLEVPSKNIRTDLSVRALIDDHKESIVERVFAAIGEVGETIE